MLPDNGAWLLVPYISDAWDHHFCIPLPASLVVLPGPDLGAHQAVDLQAVLLKAKQGFVKKIDRQLAFIARVHNSMQA